MTPTVSGRRVGLILVKVVVSLLSFAALFLFHFGVIPWVLTGIKNGAILSAVDIYFYSFPFLYWPYCILSCTRILKPRTLVVSGVIMHLALAVWVLAGGTLFPLMVGLFFTALWSVLCVVRILLKSEETSMAMHDTSYKLLWRGALGGLLGTPLFLVGLALSDKFGLGYIRSGRPLEVLALLFFLPIGAALGAMTGGIIWVFVAKVKVNLSPIMRAAIGACFILLLFGVILLIAGNENSGLISPTSTSPTLIEALVNGLLYVTSFGVMPGLMARSKEDRVAGE